MTGIAILLGGLAIILIYGGISGQNPYKEFTATLLGTKKV